MPVEIQPGDEDAILRVAAYHRHDYDLVVIRSPPHEHAPVRDSITKPFPTPSVSSLGDFSDFPVEILSAICLNMDLPSLFRFRQVNRLARTIISNLRPYRDVTNHALEALRAAMRTRIGIHFTLTDLYTELCTEKCIVCGNFGSFLFLPYFKRCCFYCLSNDSKLLVAPIINLANYTGIPQAELCERLPVVHAIPGTYSMREVRRTGGQKFVSRDFVDAMNRQKLTRNPKVDEDFYSHVTPFMCDPWTTAMVCTAFPSLDRETGEIETGVYCKGCYLWERDDPPLDFSYLTIDDEWFADRGYNKKDFLEHFKECLLAQRYWEQSQGGTVEIKEPVVTKRGGSLKFVDSHGNPR
jgi:hypothetical protein